MQWSLRPAHAYYQNKSIPSCHDSRMAEHISEINTTCISWRLGFILDELSLREPRKRADALSVSLCVFEATEPISFFQICIVFLL